MKKIIMLFMVAILATIVSCKKLTDLNEDKKNATKVPSEFLFSNATKNLVDQETTSSVNSNVFRAFAQYWTETAYIDESKYDVFKRKIPDFEFQTLYRDVLNDLNECKKVIAAETEVQSTAAQKKNKTAIVEILTVYTFQRLVDIFGSVPYTDALDVNKSPAYDDAQEIYTKLFARLDAAIADINIAESGFPKGDLIYGGNVAKWKTFAYSLKLKMGITVVDVNALDAPGKILSAVAGGVINSASGSGIFSYMDAPANYNPVYTDVTGRTDWVAANTIIDKMLSLKDPRIGKYFDGNLTPAGTYKGGVYGAGNSYANCSHLSPTVISKTRAAILIDYQETQFYLAEAAARGIVTSSTPESYYNAAITASILYWGGTAADVTAYLANPDVAYATAPGTYKEKIGTQAWIAYYDRGLVGWTTWRRLDAPKFNPPPTMSNKDIPTRFAYPIGEQTINGANYSAAAAKLAAIGGDKLNTHIFWDVL
jgi:Starch-binding associating with outer membrane